MYQDKQPGTRGLVDDAGVIPTAAGAGLCSRPLALGQGGRGG